jgi:Sulfotransferase domain
VDSDSFAAEAPALFDDGLTSITAVAPGASAGAKRRLSKLVESALGVRSTVLSRVSPSSRVESVLLLDEMTTEEEVARLWSMRSPEHVVAASGLWLVRDEGSELRWEDATGSPHRSRVSVDLPLAGPFVGPPSLLSDLDDSHQWTDTRRWLSLATAWRRNGVLCLSARLRASAIADEPLPEMRELEQLERPKGNWRLRNRVILLDAERRKAEVNLAPNPGQLAIVGAQRSGTTWASELLGSVEGLKTVREGRAFDVLIEGFPLSLKPSMAPVWQAAFLTCCRGLLIGLAARAKVVAVVRDPLEIVRSMFFNWKHLSNVAALVARLSDAAPPREPLDQAVLVVSTAWKNLLHLMEVAPDRIAFVTYDSLCADPTSTLNAAARSLGLEGDIRSIAGAARRSDLPRLSKTECDTIELHLRDLFLLLSGHAES